MEHRQTTPGSLRAFIGRRSFPELEYAVLLCLALIAVLAESGLLGGTLFLLP